MMKPFQWEACKTVAILKKMREVINVNEKQIRDLAFNVVALVIFIVLSITILIPATRIYREQTELLNTGTAAEATIEKVNRFAFSDATSVYAKLEYTVDGQNYTTEVPVALPLVNSFPAGRSQDGKTFVSVFYNADDPAKVGFEGAAHCAKTAKTVSIIVLCVSSALLLFLVIGSVVVIKERY